ncbi:Omega-amidase, chloroplastic [Trebouxia sp. C0009 RCD-2024]
MWISRLRFTQQVASQFVRSPAFWQASRAKPGGTLRTPFLPSFLDAAPKASCTASKHVRQSPCQAKAMSSEAPKQISTPKAQKVNIALCQIAVSEDKDKNIQTAKAAIQEATQAGAKLVVLPEMWNCPYSNESFPKYAEDIDAGSSASVSAMSSAAKENAVTLVAGSIPESSNGKLYNTCCVFDDQGKLLVKHRKVHLFDIDIPGKITFKESETLTQGDDFTVVDTPACRVGIGICYDLRFPELAMVYAQRGVQLIVYPGAFNMTTGPAHWELLQKARAVDNQLFVATCSPARNQGAGYTAWGHSMIIDPFAAIVAQTQESAGTVHAEIDFAQVNERRQNMPLFKQKRFDLYALIDKTLS